MFLEENIILSNKTAGMAYYTERHTKYRDLFNLKTTNSYSETYLERSPLGGTNCLERPLVLGRKSRISM